MKNHGRRTEGLVSFCYDLDQSFLLAKLISQSAKTEIGKRMNEALELQKLGADCDLSKAIDFQKEADRYLRLGRDTTPSILLLFLMTKFEAYLEDLAVLIGQECPQLIGLRPASTDEETRQEIHKRFARKRLDQIAEIFEKQLNIPFSDTCRCAEGCTPRDLDKAKAIRNIHVHGRGRVTPNFRKRISNQSLKDGEYYSITMEYLMDLKDKISLLVWGLDILATTLYPKLPRSIEDISPDDFSS